MKMHKIKLYSTALWLSLVFIPSIHAQSTIPLTAQDIVEKAIRTLGGRQKLLEVDHSLVKGTLDIKSVDIQGTFKIYSARPNKVYAWFDVNSMGVLERGYNGEVYWEKSSASGPRIFTGGELKVNRLLSYFDLLYYDQIYKELKIGSVSQVNNQPCQKIDLIAQGCNPITMSFSKTTGLPIQQEFVMPDVFEPTQVTNTIMAYKEFNGQQIPAVMVQQVRGMETLRTIQSVEFNGEFPEGIFELPQEIKTLLKEQAAQDANDAKTLFTEN